MSTHARIAPSALALTVACNYSLQLQESVPPLPPTEEEAEGDAAHWIARRFAAGYGHELPVNRKFHFEGRDWVVTMDMYAGAQMYARELGAPHPTIRIEDKLKIARVHPTLCEGTPDAWNFFFDARQAYTECPEGLPPEAFYAGQIRLVRVGDYKFGHRDVEVFENLQLSPYATGVLDKMHLDDNDPNLYVELILVQPRAYRRNGQIKIWRVPAWMLRPVINIAAMAAEAALLPNPIARTGRHCTDCKARHVCQPLQMNTAHIVDFSHTGDRVDLSAMALGQELMIVQDSIKQLEARETGLAAQAEAMMRAGHAVPFYHMEPTASRLVYLEDVTADELTSLGDLVNINVRRPLTLKEQVVTPTQAIQLGIDEAVMASYAHRPPGKLQLKRDNSITARKVFSK